MEQNNQITRDFSKYLSRKEDVNIDESFASISNVQSEFKKFNNINRWVSVAIMVVFLVAIALVFFLLSSKGTYYIYILLGIVSVYLIYSIVSSKIIKKKMNELANKVVEEYFINIDSYIFNDPTFKDVKMNYNDKFALEDLQSLDLFKDVEHFGGRDYIVGNFKKGNFSFGDALIRTEEVKADGKKQKFIVFLGKMMILNAATKLASGRCIIYLKGKGSNGPTKLDGLTKVENILSPKFDVYASSQIDDLLSDKAKSALEELNNDDLLLDVFILIEPKRVAFGLSYADSLMTIPLFEKVNEEITRRYKEDFDKETKFLKEFLK